MLCLLDNVYNSVIVIEVSASNIYNMLAFIIYVIVHDNKVIRVAISVQINIVKEFIRLIWDNPCIYLASTPSHTHVHLHTRHTQNTCADSPNIRIDPDPHFLVVVPDYLFTIYRLGKN